jgi:hypothetical protein
MTRPSFRNSFARLGVLLLAAGLLSGATETTLAAPRPSAFVLGQVSVKRKNLATTTTLQANDKLYPGDVIASAKGATVQFTDGSRVDMADNAVLEITKADSVPGGGKTLFRALNGRMAAHLRPGKVIATRTSLVRVKGTIVLISVDDDGTSTLSVLEGAAEFFNPCGSVLVPAGQQSVVKPGYGPSDPSVIPDVQGLLRDWRDQTDILKPFVQPGVQATGATAGDGPAPGPEPPVVTATAELVPKDEPAEPEDATSPPADKPAKDEKA